MFGKQMDQQWQYNIKDILDYTNKGATLIINSPNKLEKNISLLDLYSSLDSAHFWFLRIGKISFLSKVTAVLKMHHRDAFDRLQAPLLNILALKPPPCRPKSEKRYPCKAKTPTRVNTKNHPTPL